MSPGRYENTREGRPGEKLIIMIIIINIILKFHLNKYYECIHQTARISSSGSFCRKEESDGTGKKESKESAKETDELEITDCLTCFHISRTSETCALY